MVKSGLNVGDTFEDDGRYFKVLSVSDNGYYTSTLIEKPIEGVAKEPTNGEKTYTRTDIKRMSKDALLVMAKENGIECNEETAGTEIKEALITKLEL